MLPFTEIKNNHNIHIAQHLKISMGGDNKT